MIRKEFAIENFANRIINGCTPIHKGFMDKAEAEREHGFKLYQGGVVQGNSLRVVDIEGIDTEACCGTHCDSTAEVGWIKLIKIEVGQTIVLHNVFFDFGKYKLRKESYSELNRIVKLLNSNPNMKIEVSGHTDNVGGISFNDLLSFNRANAVTHYLLGKSKIESDRIVSAHYGEQNPVADNTTAKGRQLNRRVEFKILTK